MGEIVLIFSHGADWISRLISWFTFGRYTHVALVCGHRVIEASGTGQPQGVREVSLWDWLDRHPDFEWRTIRHPRPDAVWDRAATQIGKGYDYLGLFGWLTRFGWHDRDRWTCSELVAWASAATGHPLLDADHNTVTPRDLYMISEAV